MVQSGYTIVSTPKLRPALAIYEFAASFRITFLLRLVALVVIFPTNTSKWRTQFMNFIRMTTAARPTFEPARGGRGKGEGDLSQLSKQYSSRDLPSHTKIKYRQTTQDAPEEVRSRDFRRELEERERVVVREKNRDRPPREHTSSVSKKPRLDQIPAANLDADDPLTDEDEDDDDSDEDSDDDTAALLAELEKIKKERAEEQARKRAVFNLKYITNERQGKNKG
ncbi:unnamed protein product [Ranitomeya imitator]|uniref:Uncharacterized protein n=1 Tax=Ranitomeya imitator TaxID=111125 RepID=A0ABN9LFQ3_9NEOB|nr:unnamed protein product [Ranitomeya imitator]